MPFSLSLDIFFQMEKLRKTTHIRICWALKVPSASKLQPNSNQPHLSVFDFKIPEPEAPCGPCGQEPPARASGENVCGLLDPVRGPRTWSAAGAALCAQSQAEPRAHRRLDGGQRASSTYDTSSISLIPLTPCYDIHNFPWKTRSLRGLLLTRVFFILSTTDLYLLVPKSTVIMAGTWVPFCLMACSLHSWARTWSFFFFLLIIAHLCGCEARAIFILFQLAMCVILEKETAIVPV